MLFKYISLEGLFFKGSFSSSYGRTTLFPLAEAASSYPTSYLIASSTIFYTVYEALSFKYDFLISTSFLIRLKNGLLLIAGPFLFMPSNYSLDIFDFAMSSNLLFAS